MTIKVDKKSPWSDPHFEPFELKTADGFAQVDSRGLGLRGFVEQEIQARSATSSGTNTTLVPGKIYLRQLRDGTYELLVYRGRSTYDAYPGETAEELLEFAKTFVKEPAW